MARYIYSSDQLLLDNEVFHYRNPEYSLNCKYLEKVRKLLTVINQNYKNIFRYVDEIDILPHNVMPSDFGYERIKLPKNEPLASAVAEKAKRKKLTKEQKILNRKLEQAEVLRLRYLVVAKEILKILCKLRVYYQEKLQERRNDIKSSAIAHENYELVDLCDKELNRGHDKIKQLEDIYKQILDFISTQSFSRICNEDGFVRQLDAKKTLSKEAMNEVEKINWLLNGLVKFAAHYQDQRDKGIPRKRTHYVFVQHRIDQLYAVGDYMRPISGIIKDVDALHDYFGERPF